MNFSCILPSLESDAVKLLNVIKFMTKSERYANVGIGEFLPLLQTVSPTSPPDPFALKYFRLPDFYPDEFWTRCG